MGNMFAFTGSDVFGRFQRLPGYDVFEPIGYDAFGIHTENYAIKLGHPPGRADPAEHRELPPPADAHRRHVRLAPRALHHRSRPTTSGPSGSSCSSSRRARPTRRRRRSTGVPNDKTVLANEQVVNGHCERCGAAVEQRFLEQWFFRITDYAERLLANLDDTSKMDWSDTTSHGAAQLDRPLGRRRTRRSRWTGRRRRPSRVFTTRPDTLFGATFMVLAPEHPLVRRSSPPATRRTAVEAYRAQAAAQDLVSRKVGDKEKTGVFTGAYADQPGHRRARFRSGSPTTC